MVPVFLAFAFDTDQCLGFPASDDSEDARLACVLAHLGTDLGKCVCASAGSAPAGELVMYLVFHE